MTTPTLDARFLTFADHECADEPLYDALCRIVAGQPTMLDLLSGAADPQRRPNLWLAAVHDQLLAGARHPLREYYASLGGVRAPDAALAATLGDFVDRHRETLRQTMATRTTQTNEVGRCAVLRPALQAIARRTGQPRLALLDVGCSAGLNLGVDVYRYGEGEGDGGGDATDRHASPRLLCRLVGPHRPSPAPVEIRQRLGLDPAPVDVNDERAVRWLRACLWPTNTARARRFDQAVGQARRHAWPVRQEADCTAALEPWLDSLPADVQPVVLNSWVLTYFDSAALKRHIEKLQDLVQGRGVAWLSAEAPEMRIGALVAPPPAEAGVQARRGSLWTLAWRDGGRLRFELLARSHPHGSWMEWLATA